MKKNDDFSGIHIFANNWRKTFLGDGTCVRAKFLIDYKCILSHHMTLNYDASIYDGKKL